MLIQGPKTLLGTPGTVDRGDMGKEQTAPYSQCVRDAMTVPVLAVAAETRVEDVAHVLTEHKIGAVPVVDARRRVLGVIAESDIVSRADAAASTAEHVMTTPVIAVEADAPLAEARRALAAHGIGRLPVVDRRRRLIGINGLALEPTAPGSGLREWFEHLGRGDGKRAAAFDTRLSAPPLFTGRASLRIAKRLRKSGFDLAEDPVSFLVDKQNHLRGELERAQSWGERLVG
ncbi:MAG: CBS domain-containing protein [Catenulispora sp.]|nr:CBS domain-containing protein [Catenulispora sp.]